MKIQNHQKIIKIIANIFLYLFLSKSKLSKNKIKLYHQIKVIIENKWNIYLECAKYPKEIATIFIIKTHQKIRNSLYFFENIKYKIHKI